MNVPVEEAACPSRCLGRFPEIPARIEDHRKGMGGKEIKPAPYPIVHLLQPIGQVVDDRRVGGGTPILDHEVRAKQAVEL